MIFQGKLLSIQYQMILIALLAFCMESWAFSSFHPILPLCSLDSSRRKLTFSSRSSTILCCGSLSKLATMFFDQILSRALHAIRISSFNSFPYATLPLSFRKNPLVLGRLKIRASRLKSESAASHPLSRNSF